MTGTIMVDWGNIERLLGSMETVGDDAAAMNQYVSGYVCSTAGYDYATCALEPLAQAMPTIAGWFEDAMRLFDKRWAALGAAVADASRGLSHEDEATRTRIHALLATIGHEPLVTNVCTAPDEGATNPVELFPVVPISLEPPDDGEDRLTHDETFSTIAEAWDESVKVVNGGIGILNLALSKIGRHLDTLPDESLQDYLVYPLSGNYKKLQANASAARTAGRAFGQWGTNFAHFAVRSELALKGQAGAGFEAQLGLYDVVMHACGGVMNLGGDVFDTIADVSEQIAVEVEKALVYLGKKLLALVEKISSRVLGGLAWIKLAIDIAEHGIDVVLDIVHDVEDCIHIIKSCFELLDKIKDWAEAMRKRLTVFEHFVDAMQRLPVVADSGQLAHADKGLRKLEQQLHDLSDDAGSADVPSLGGDLTGLVDDARSHGTPTEEPPDPDGPTMEAPGPLAGLPPGVGDPGGDSPASPTVI